MAGRGRAGFKTVATSAASDEIAVTLSVGQNAVALTWSPVALASEYRVYRTSDPPEAPARTWVYYTVTANAFTDIGDLLSVGNDSQPPERGTRWTVKNLFELKNARRVLIEGNVFENNWLDAQTGYAILFKSANQSGSAPWTVTEDVTFTNNIVRHTGAGINILGESPNFPSEKVKRVEINNNLFEDVDKEKWGGDGNFLKITDVTDVQVDHNTVLHTGSIILAYGEPTRGFKFTNNLMGHNAYGVKGDGTSSGNETIEKYFPDILFKKNVIAGASSGHYPTKKNYYPASLDDVKFVDRAQGNYRLSKDSPYKGAGTKDRDIGADIDAIEAATAGVVTPG